MEARRTPGTNRKSHIEGESFRGLADSTPATPCRGTPVAHVVQERGAAMVFGSADALAGVGAVGVVAMVVRAGLGVGVYMRGELPKPTP